MIKNYQNSSGSIKNFVKLLSHCYHNDKAVKMGELHIFSESSISKEKATDIYIDTSQKIYGITQDANYEVDDYDIESFSERSYETTQSPAISRRFEIDVKRIVNLFFYERSEDWALHIVDTKRKWDFSLQEYC